MLPRLHNDPAWVPGLPCAFALAIFLAQPSALATTDAPDAPDLPAELAVPAAACQSGSAGCAWERPRDPSAVATSVGEWLSRHAPGRFDGFDVSVDRSDVTITLKTGETSTILGILLRGPCDRPPDVHAPGLSLPGSAMDELVRELPLVRKPICVPTATLPGEVTVLPPPRGTVMGILWSRLTDSLRTDQRAPGSWPGTDRVAFLLLAFLGVIAAAVTSGARGRTRHHDIALNALVLALGALALVPVMTAPLETGSEVERVVLARMDLFLDWNHPPLIYLLSHPVTRLTLEPWAVRLVPGAAVVVLSLLILHVARRWAGNVPAVIAAAWYLAGARSRRGLTDLGDWDLAGCFLIALVILVQRMDIRRGEQGRVARATFILAVVLATLSSWLALVPLAVLAAVLLFRSRTRREWLPVALATTAVVALRGVRAWQVFQHGKMFDWGPESWQGLVVEMASQIQPGATWIGLLLIPVGLLGILARQRGPSQIYVAGSLVALPLAVLGIWHLSASNGGYYVNLAAGFAAIIGAVGLRFAAPFPSGAWTGAMDPPSRVLPSKMNTVLAACFAGLAVLLTVDLPATHYRDGIGNAPEFGRRIDGDTLPVVTDLRGLGPLVLYHQAADSDLDLGRVRHLRDIVMQPEYGDGTRTWTILDHGSVVLDRSRLPGNTPFHLVLSNASHRGHLDQNHRDIALLRRCRTMFPPRDDATFMICPPVE